MAQPKRYELTAEQWCGICDLLPGKVPDPGRSGIDNLNPSFDVDPQFRSNCEHFQLRRFTLGLCVDGSNPIKAFEMIEFSCWPTGERKLDEKFRFPIRDLVSRRCL